MLFFPCAILSELATRSKIRVRVIAHIVCNAVFVGGFKQAQTGYLVKIIALLVHHNRHVLLLNTVRRKQLHKIILTESFKGTSVVFTVAGRCQIDRLVAVPRPVVIALALGSVGMANVVRIVLFEFVRINIVLLGELLLPIPEGLIHSQTNTL